MSKNKTTYKNIPEWDKKSLVQIKDTFPTPEELVFKPKLRKVTIALSEDSLAFFKQEAKKLNSSYQYMIRSLLDDYTRQSTTQK